MCIHEYSKELTLLYAVKWCNYWNSKPPDTIWNHPQPTGAIWNHPETTQNYLHQWKFLSFHRATSHQILPSFSIVDFEHDFIIRKVQLGKNRENLTMIMKHKGKIKTLSQNPQRFITLKQAYNIRFEWSYITNKGSKISTFVSANMIFTTLILNHDASLVV